MKNALLLGLFAVSSLAASDRDVAKQLSFEARAKVLAREAMKKLPLLRPISLVEESVVVGKNYAHDPLGRAVLDKDTSKKLADEAVAKLPNLNKIGEQARPEVKKETAAWQNKKLNNVGEVQRPEIKKETASWQNTILKQTGKLIKLIEESVVVGKNYAHDPLGRAVLDKDTSKKLADEAVKKLPNLNKIGEQARPEVKKETAAWQNQQLKNVGQVQRPEIKKETANWQNIQLKPTGKAIKLAEDVEEPTTTIKKVKKVVVGAVKGGFEKVKSTWRNVKDKVLRKKE